MSCNGLIKQREFQLRLFVALLSLLFILPSLSPTLASEIPARLQLQLFVKILAFDHKFQDRTGDKLIVGVVYQEKFPESVQARAEIETALKTDSATTIKGLKIHAVFIPFRSVSDLERRLAADSIDLLYVTPLRSVEISEIAAISQRRHVVTLSGVSGYVHEGLAIGLFLREDRPRILINLKASRAEGAEISAQVLKLAEVIQ